MEKIYKFSLERRNQIRLSKLGKKRPDMIGNTFRKGLVGPNKGREFSESWKENIRKSKSGSNHPNYGKVRTDETRRRIGLARSGEKCNFWKGGITPINKAIRKGIEWKLWREKVFKRDNWTCQECGTRGTELHPHHIKPFAHYPDQRFDINNGMTICRECHQKTESWGHRSNTIIT